MSNIDGKCGRISFEKLPEETQHEIVERWIDKGEINLFRKIDEHHYGLLDIKPVIKEALCPGSIFVFLDASAEELENQIKVVRLQRCDEEQLIDAGEEVERVVKLLDCTQGSTAPVKVFFGDVPVPYTVFYDWYNEGNPSLFSKAESCTELMACGNLLIAMGTDPVTGKLNGFRPFDIDEFVATDCIVIYASKTDDEPNRLAFLSKRKKGSGK